MFAQKAVGKGLLGAFIAQDFKLRRRQQRLPFGVGLFNFKGGKAAGGGQGGQPGEQGTGG